MDTWKLTASGRVQGVGFRYSVQIYADTLGLNGTVKNNPDGTVTIFLQADEKTVDNFINNLPEHVSPYAKIENVDTEKVAETKKMHGFHVVY